MSKWGITQIIQIEWVRCQNEDLDCKNIKRLDMEITGTEEKKVIYIKEDDSPYTGEEKKL